MPDLLIVEISRRLISLSKRIRGFDKNSWITFKSVIIAHIAFIYDGTAILMRIISNATIGRSRASSKHILMFRTAQYIKTIEIQYV